MQLNQLFVAAALAAVAHGQVSAQQMVSNIDQITQLSSQTNNIAMSISVTNFFNTAPQLINNFRQIIEIASDDVTSMGGSSKKMTKRQDCLNVEDVEQCLEDLGQIIEDPSELLGDKKVKRAGSVAARSAVEVEKRQAAPPYTPENQEAICDSFRDFVQVHQQLLATVIGKHGLLSVTPFTQPLAQVLRTLEGGVDTLAFAIIDDVPTCAQDATDNKNSLDQVLEQAVNTYSD